jgi:hypothetical protein
MLFVSSRLTHSSSRWSKVGIAGLLSSLGVEAFIAFLAIRRRLVSLNINDVATRAVMSSCSHISLSHSIMTRSTHVSQASFQHPPSTLQCLVLHPSQSQRILVYDVTSNNDTFVRIVGFEISEAWNVRWTLEAYVNGP